MRFGGFPENPSNKTRRRVQQIAAPGPLESGSSFSGLVNYHVDTDHGNSGSPVTVAEAGEAVAIHILSGCFAGIPDSANSGVGIGSKDLQAALQNPRGICAGSVTQIV